MCHRNTDSIQGVWMENMTLQYERPDAPLVRMCRRLTFQKTFSKDGLSLYRVFSKITQYDFENATGAGASVVGTEAVHLANAKRNRDGSTTVELIDVDDTTVANAVVSRGKGRVTGGETSAYASGSNGHALVGTWCRHTQNIENQAFNREYERIWVKNNP